jgi:sugar lactone lactonase YvrE
MSKLSVFDDRRCQLGEGPLWHPGRQQLFWFDILGNKLLSRREGRALTWSFDEAVSAAGWVSETELLIASETCLFRFDVNNGEQLPVQPLEADNPGTRSNDGRADPWGGFWISTMSWQEEAGAGSLYRYYQGALSKLESNLTIPNAICFPPDASCVYWADTKEGLLWRQPLEPLHGWPAGNKQLVIDFAALDLNPDGAIVDARGYIWSAQWGAGRVACYCPAGIERQIVSLPTSQTSCPAFGGERLDRLYVTTAARGLDAEDRAAGNVFSVPVGSGGQAEHRVKLVIG